jgi:hypothetical protein
MAPPLLQLSGIALTFGGTPLLEGADLAVSAGERIALVGRNGSGKSTLLRIAAGLVEADRGERFLQPGTTVRYLPQEPDLAGFPNTLAYVEAGLGPADDRYRARYLLEQLGLSGEEEPSRLSGGEGRGHRARACTRARYPAPRRAHQPSRPAGHRMARSRAYRRSRRTHPDQPRPPLSAKSLAQHGLARPWPDKARRNRLRRLRGLA